MFIIGEAVIDDVVGSASFCCDLKKCKGACCTLPGGRGAPLEDDEVVKLQRSYPSARQYLSQRSIDAIEAMGIVEGAEGGYATTCIDNRDCVFVYYDDDVAKCSLERAYEEGKTDWRKPVSCHLFPLRIRTFGQDFVRYEEIDECKPGRMLGDQEHVKLYDFLKAPLTRKYGETWYQRFADRCKSLL
jgi:hypothetical protein